VPSIIDPAARQQIERRLDSLSPEHRGAWGRLTVGGMVCHCYDAVRTAVGQNPAPLLGKFGPLRPLLAWLMIDVLPWPKGKAKTVRQMLSTKEGDLAGDVQRLQRSFGQVIDRGAQESWGVHPLFGPLSRAQWGRLIWRHVDYHLKQFGV